MDDTSDWRQVLQLFLNKSSDGFHAANIARFDNHLGPQELKLADCRLHIVSRCSASGDKHNMLGSTRCHPSSNGPSKSSSTPD